MRPILYVCISINLLTCMINKCIGLKKKYTFLEYKVIISISKIKILILIVLLFYTLTFILVKLYFSIINHVSFICKYFLL